MGSNSKVADDGGGGGGGGGERQQVVWLMVHYILGFMVFVGVVLPVMVVHDG